MFKLQVSKYKWSYIFLLFLYYNAVDATEKTEKRIICYVKNNNLNADNYTKFNLDDINVHLCTHLVYSFATIQEVTLLPWSKNLDVDLGNFTNFTQLKSQNPELKTIISIRESQNEFSNLLQNTRVRQSLIRNILKFVTEFHYDGVDILWKNLGSDYGNECDKNNYVKFVKEIREKFNEEATKTKAEPFAISIELPYDINIIKQGYDVAKLNQYVDWFNIMSYDSKELFLIHSSNRTDTIDPLNYYLNVGASRDKLVLGISTYGLQFTTESKSSDSLSTESLKGLSIDFDSNDNFIPYSQICDKLKHDASFKLVKGKIGALPRIFALKQNKVVVFKDVTIVTEEVEYVIDQNLSGMSFWSMNEDDFHGLCIDKPYPLLNTAKKVLLQKLSLRNSRSTDSLSTANNAEKDISLPTKVISKDRIVCYTTSWSIYRTGPARFDQSLINPNLCTHIIYAYARVNNVTVEFADENSDLTLNGYANYIKLRSENENLKLLIGLRVTDSKFSSVVGNPKQREIFITNVLKHLKDYKFDGIDIVWKYPGINDKENFVELLKEMRKQFNTESLNSNRTEPYLISIIIPSEIELAETGYDLRKLNDVVDWYNLLSYDYHFSKENTVNHHSPLFQVNSTADDNLNVNASVNYYLNAGIERTQLVVGIPTYGITFTLKNATMINFGATAEGPGLPGKFTNISGAISYFEICESLLTDSNWRIYRPFPDRVGPYIVNENQWIAYDDEVMVKVKAEYVADMGLGGMMFWTVDQDDFRGICSSTPNFLVQIAKTALLNKLNLDNSNLISPTTPLTTTNVKMQLSEENVAPITTTKRPLTSALADKDRAEESINNRIVCYTTNWSVYRTGAARFTQNLIDPNLCTHIIYAYGKITENNTFVSSDENSDYTNAGYVQLNELKKVNPNLRTLIGVRDYSQNSSIFPVIMALKERRQELIQSIVSFITENNFDGVDIVWKNPMVSDKNNFVKFIKEIAQEFDEQSRSRSGERFLLSIAAPGKKQEIESYDIGKLNEYVNWFNVLSYNYHAASESEVNHAAALYALPETPFDELNVNFTATQYLNAGADRNKLVIIIPTYGRTFTLANISQTNFGSPAENKGQGGTLTRLPGSLAYYEICDFLLQDSGWQRFQPYPKIVGPYIVKVDQWVSYDDEDMMQTKADYVAENGFGGLGFWSIDQDDFRGNCDSTPFRLITTAKSRLIEKLSIQADVPIIKPLPEEVTTATMTTITTTTQTSVSSTAQTVATVTSPTSIDNSVLGPPINDQNTNSLTANTEGLTEKRDRIVCYAPNWSTYRKQVAKFDASFILPDLCTHLIYAFAILENDTVVSSDRESDFNRMGYENFNKLKLKNPNLATLISVTQRTNFTQFTDLVNDAQRRERFVKNLLDFIKTNKFNGVDFVWQYPGENPRDKENFVKFLSEIRSKFQEDASATQSSRLLLTITAPSEKIYLDRGYDIPNLNGLVDWFNLLSYDYHLPTETLTYHHAPLYSMRGINDSDNNVNATVYNYLNAGIERNKLVVGIPTYGITFTLADENLTTLNSPAVGPGMKGELSGNAGSLAFYEICQNVLGLSDSGWQVQNFEPTAVGPYAFKGNQWVAYDDEAMVRRKAEYVADKGLGGLMFWTMDQDDFRGICFRQPNILIQTGKETLSEKLSVTPGSITTSSPPINILQVNQNTVTTVPNFNRSSSSNDFVCPDIGLYANPRDCKSYYACLDLFELQQGIVSQLLTCPNGTYFDSERQDCKFNENDEQCGKLYKESDTARPSTSSTTISTSSSPTPIMPTVEITPMSNVENSTVNRVLQLIQNIGGLEKFEQFLKIFSSATLPDTSVAKDIGSNSNSGIINAENNKKVSLSTQFSVGNSPNEIIKSGFEIPKRQNNAKDIILPEERIYQIKELHIHNYREPILDEKGLDDILKGTNADQQLGNNKNVQPYILLAPVQIINKVY